MRKAFVVAGLALAGAAGAQGIQFSGGAAVTSLNFGFNLGVQVLDLANLNGVPVDARISADFTGGDVGTLLNTDILFNFPLDTFNLYAGVGASFALNGLNNPGVFATATVGANLPVAEQFGVFTEAVLRYNFNTFNRSTIRAGVTYIF